MTQLQFAACLHAACLLAGGLILSSAAEALPAGSIAISSTQVFQLSVNSKLVTCGPVNGINVPIDAVAAHPDMYQPLSAAIKETKKKAAKASGKKKEKLLKKLKKLKARQKVEAPQCLNANPNQSTPTATPTPPISGSACFDSIGDVTAAGKIKFKIPNLAANTTFGQALHDIKCTGCHGQQLGFNFDQLRSATSQPPMSFTTTELPDDELAHITAYLNRFLANCD